MWPCGPGIPLPEGKLGESVPGVLGPLDEAADVKDDWEPVFELAAEDIELTRGDAVLEEYDCGSGNGLSAYNDRWGAAWAL